MFIVVVLDVATVKRKPGFESEKKLGQ